MPYQTLFNDELLCSSTFCDFYSNFPVKKKIKKKIIEKCVVNASLSFEILIIKYSEIT